MSPKTGFDKPAPSGWTSSTKPGAARPGQTGADENGGKGGIIILCIFFTLEIEIRSHFFSLTKIICKGHVVKFLARFNGGNNGVIGASDTPFPLV